MEWSWTTWLISVAAVVISGTAAWREGCWVKRPGLDMGFANHGGMWGDLVLLPIANAVIVPQLTIGSWTAGAMIVSTIASAWVHHHWHRGSSRSHPSPPAASSTGYGVGARRSGESRESGHSREHMWPSRPRGTWYGDLSWAGWLHVLYVIGELSILVGFLVHPMPTTAVLAVAAVFTIHVPIGLLQPPWFLTGCIVSLRRQPLLLPCLAALWIVAAAKM